MNLLLAVGLTTSITAFLLTLVFKWTKPHHRPLSLLIFTGVCWVIGTVLIVAGILMLVYGSIQSQQYWMMPS